MAKAKKSMKECVQIMINHLGKLIDESNPKEAHALKCDAGTKAAIPRLRKELQTLEKVSKNVRGMALELKK